MLPSLRKPSPALIVALLALVLAMAGGAYAATQLPANSVGTTQLQNGAVTNQKIANGAVGNTKLDSELQAMIAQHGAQGPPGMNGTNGTNGTNGANPGLPVINVPPVAASGAGGPDTGPAGDQGFYFTGSSGGTAALTNGELEVGGAGVDSSTTSGGVGIAKAYSNIPLGNLNALSYDWHANEVNSNQAPTVHMSVTGAQPDSKFPTSGFTNLVYTPGLNGVTVTQAGSFQADTFAPGAKWYSTGTLPNSPTTVGSQDDPQPLSYFVGHDPNAVIGQISLDNGGSSGGSGTFDAGADNLIIGFSGSPFVRYDLGG